MENLFKKHAKIMKSVWDRSKKKADSGQIGDIFEDGRYKMGVVDAQATEAKSGNFMVVFTCAFLDGEYIGKNKKIFRTITPDKAEDNLARIILDINTLGFEIEDFEQIESALEEIRAARPVVRVTLKTRSGSDYQDGYIEKLLTGEVAANTEDQPESGEAVPGDDSGPAEDTVDVGSTVTFNWKGKDLQGEIKEFIENDTKAKVKVDKLIYTVKLEDLTLVKDETPEAASEDVPEEPVEEPTPEPEPEEDSKPVRRVVKKVGKDLKKKKK
jgi:hypothetical protein